MREWFVGLNWSQRVGYVFGAAYVAAGAIGFIVTSGIGFFATQGNDLVILEINPLHNIVHLGIGVALILAARSSPAASRLMNRLIGGTYLLVAVAGAIVVELDTSLFSGLVERRSDLNILALNHPDNVFHLVSFLILVGSTLIGRRRTADSVTETPTASSKKSEATGELAATEVDEEAVNEQHDEPVSAVPARRVSSSDRLVAGALVPRSGTYRCACGNFVVAIRQNRDFPDCPEPTGTDDDHYFLLQRSQPKAKPKAKAKSSAKR